jgi:hypothetical protein
VNCVTQGYFTKVALLRHVFDDPEGAARFEWVWWLDADANVVDVDFQFPWARYAKKDIVVWGSEEHVVHPHPEMGASEACMSVYGLHACLSVCLPCSSWRIRTWRWVRRGPGSRSMAFVRVCLPSCSSWQTRTRRWVRRGPACPSVFLAFRAANLAAAGLPGPSPCLSVRPNQSAGRTSDAWLRGAGLNSGILLLRPSEVTREFMRQWQEIGHKEWAVLIEVRMGRQTDRQTNARLWDRKGLSSEADRQKRPVFQGHGHGHVRASACDWQAAGHAV